MAGRYELLKMARDQRAMAARARRLAQGLSLEADHQRLLQYAIGLDDEARLLECQAAALRLDS